MQNLANKNEFLLGSRSDSRLNNLDIFRAVAALAVCFHHFQRETLTGGTFFAEISQYGKYGVDIFFVISGYVIPLALIRKGFVLRDIWVFLKARFFRLYPAYILAAVITVALWYASSWVPGFRGGALPGMAWPQILANLTLTCDFFHQDWFGVVFWTLAIEAQYYVIVALCFGLIFRPGEGNAWFWQYTVVLLWAVLPLLFKGGPAVFGWTALFAMGMLALLWQTGLISKFAFAVLLFASVLVQYEI